MISKVNPPIIAGVCVIKTLGAVGGEYEYRTAILNHEGDLHKRTVADGEDKAAIMIKNARELFKNAPVFSDLREACMEGEKIKESLDVICKYGVFVTPINRPFNEC